MQHLDQQFPHLISFFRKRAKLTQDELGQASKLHFTDISKLERGERKPPKLEHTLLMIRALNLSTAEAKELLEAGGYPPLALNKIKFDPTLYPVITKEVALARLRGERGVYPTLLLTNDGIITGINLLAMANWLALSLLDTKPDPSKVLGWCIFELYARPENFYRISAPRRLSDFLYTKIIVFRKLEEFLPLTAVHAFKERIYENPVLQLIYENGTVELGQEWTYYLKIKPPNDSFFSSITNLEFEGHVERIMDEDTQTGFLVTYQPLRETVKVMINLHQALLDHFGEDTFTQYLGTREIRRPSRYPTYCPTYILNYLWTITDENAACKRITGTQAKGMHVFDYLLSESVHESIASEPAYAIAMKTLRTFFILTRPYQNKDHPYYTEYQELMKRFTQRQEFRTLFSKFFMSIVPAELEAEIRDGEVRYHLTLKSSYHTSFRLSLMSILHFTHTQLPEYIVVHVPENDETKATLILLQLEDAIGSEEQKGDTELAHLIWSLTILQTVKEGLAKSIEAGEWNAHTAFDRLKNELTSTLDFEEAAVSEDLATQIRLTTIELLVQVAPESKEHIQELIERFFAHTPVMRQILAKEQETNTSNNNYSPDQLLERHLGISQN